MDTARAADLAIQNVIKEGLTDIFDRPKELDLLNNKLFQKELAKKVKKSIEGLSLESLDMSPIHHVLLPKNTPFSFRRCALIQPIDTIKYLALVITLAEKIEKSRIPTKRNIIYSYRFKPQNGYLFNQKYHLTSFKKLVEEKRNQKNVNYLVKCDISNFYDRINLHRLESILLSIGLPQNEVRLLNNLLLFWSKRDSYGLPIGSNASRILAEAALSEVDKYLLSNGVTFMRFVDDYRFFSPDSQTAHFWLSMLIERLWLEGLTINQLKTSISPTTITENFKDKKIVAQPETLDTAQGPSVRPSKILAGYGGIVPTRFRELSEKETADLKSKDEKEILKGIKSSPLPQPEEIKKFTKTVVAKESFDLLVELPELTEVYPQFTPFAVDTLLKYGSRIQPKFRTKIMNKYSKKLSAKNSLPEYIAVAIVKLLGSEHYSNKEVLMQYLRILKRNAGAYIGRTLFESLESLANRNDVIEIRTYFDRSDQWEKRQIARMVNKHLHEDEKRPWFKNIAIQEPRDLLLKEFMFPTKKTKVKQKNRRSPSNHSSQTPQEPEKSS